MESQPTNTADDAYTAESVITAALATLPKNNPIAYGILCTLNREGFFEKPQLKSSFNKIAKQLIDTIQPGGVEDEN